MSKGTVSKSRWVSRIREAGARLAHPPHDLAQLLNILNHLRFTLEQVGQKPAKWILKALKPTIRVLIDDRLFKHADVDVRVAVASCIVEVTRITSPDEPYGDDQMKEVFQLVVSSFENLSDISSQTFKKRASMLRTFANIQLCVLMLDLECDSLILEMFQYFLKEIRDQHPPSVLFAMESIMIIVFEESDEISPELVSLLLATMKKNNEEVQRMAVILVEHVFQKTSNLIKKELMQAVKASGLSIDEYDEVVAGICQEAPSVVEEDQPTIATATASNEHTLNSDKKAPSGISDEELPLSGQMSNKGSDKIKSKTTLKETASKDDESNGQTSSFQILENQSANFASLLPNENILHTKHYKRVRQPRKKKSLIRFPVHANEEFQKISVAAGGPERRTPRGSNKNETSGISDEQLPSTVQISNKETGSTVSEMTPKETGTKGEESNAHIPSFKIVENQCTNVDSLLPNEGLKMSPVRANAEFQKISEATGDLEMRMHGDSNGKETSGNSDEELPFTVQMANKDDGTCVSEMTLKDTGTKGEESDVQISSFKIVENWSTDVGSFLPSGNLVHEKPYKEVGPQTDKDVLKVSPVRANAESQNISEVAGDTKMILHGGSSGKETSGNTDDKLPLTVHMSNKDSGTCDSEMTLKETRTNGEESNAQVSALKIVENHSTDVGFLLPKENIPYWKKYLRVRQPKKKKSLNGSIIHASEEFQQISAAPGGPEWRMPGGSNKKETSGNSDEELSSTVQMSNKETGTTEMVPKETGTKGGESNAQISSFKIGENQSTDVGSFIQSENLIYEKPYKEVGPQTKKDGLKMSPVRANAESQNISEVAGDTKMILHGGSSGKETSGNTDDKLPLTVHMSNKDSCTCDSEMTLKETRTNGVESNAQVSALKIVENHSTDVGFLLPKENIPYWKKYLRVRQPKKKKSLNGSLIHASEEFQQISAAPGGPEWRMPGGSNKKETSGNSDEELSSTVQMSNKETGTTEMAKETGTKGGESNAQISSFKIGENQCTDVASLLPSENLIYEKPYKEVGPQTEKDGLKMSPVRANAECQNISEVAGDTKMILHGGSSGKETSENTDDKLPLTVHMSNKDSGTCDSEMTLKETRTNGVESNAQVSALKIVENRSTDVGFLLPKENIPYWKKYLRVRQPKKKKSLNGSLIHASEEFRQISAAPGGPEWRMPGGSNKKETSGNSDEELSSTVQMSNKETGTTEMVPKETGTKGGESNAQISSFKIGENQSTDVASLLPSENLIYEKPYKEVGPQPEKDGLKMSPVRANAECQNISEVAGDTKMILHGGSSGKETSGNTDDKLPLTVHMSNKDSGTCDSEMTLKETRTNGEESNAQVSALKIEENHSTDVGFLLPKENIPYWKKYLRVRQPKKKKSLNGSLIHASEEFQQISAAPGGPEWRMPGGSNKKETSGNSDEELSSTVQMSNKETGTTEMVPKETGTKGGESNAQISSFKIGENQSTDVASLLPSENLIYEKPYKEVGPQTEKDGLKMSPVRANAESQNISEVAGDTKMILHGGSSGKEPSENTDDKLPLTVHMSNKDSGMCDSEMTLKETRTIGEENNAQISAFKMVDNGSIDDENLLSNENLMHGMPYKKVRPPKEKEHLKMSPVRANAEFQKMSEAAVDTERMMNGDKKTNPVVSGEDQLSTVNMSNENSGTSYPEITLKEAAKKSDTTKSLAMENIEGENSLSKDVEKDALDPATKSHHKSMSKDNKEKFFSPHSSKKSTNTEYQENPGMNSKRKQTRERDCVSNIKTYGAELVPRRIKVLWPLDKMFYRGVVKSYDPVVNKHKVLYEDGDVEILCMQNEIWDFVESDCDSYEEEATDPPASDASSKLPAEKKMKRTFTSGTTSRNGEEASSGRANDSAIMSDYEANDGENLKEMSQSGAQAFPNIVDNQRSNVRSILSNDNLLHEQPTGKVRQPKKKKERNAGAESKMASELAIDTEMRLSTSEEDDKSSPNGKKGAEITLKRVETERDATKSSAKEINLEKKGRSEDVRRDVLNSATEFNEKAVAKDDQDKTPHSSMRSSNTENQEETSGMNPKRKRTTEGDGVSNIKISGAELVHHRIKVLWPLEKTFYRGVVESYDPVANMHKVLYDDGDVEILFMQNETWDFVESDSESYEEEAADPPAFEDSSKLYNSSRGRVSSGRAKNAAIISDDEAEDGEHLKEKSQSGAQVSPDIVENQTLNIRSFLPNDNLLHEKPFGMIGRAKKKNELDVNADSEKASDLAIDTEIRLSTSEENHGSSHNGKNEAEITSKEAAVKRDATKSSANGINSENEGCGKDIRRDVLNSASKFHEKTVAKADQEVKVSALKSSKKSREAEYSKEETSGTNSKRKRVSKVNKYGTDLVHCRIRVWWPLEQRFYKGVVKSYDPTQNKHTILYDDGDVEVLNMKNETWEFA